MSRGVGRGVRWNQPVEVFHNFEAADFCVLIRASRRRHDAHYDVSFGVRHDVGKVLNHRFCRTACCAEDVEIFQDQLPVDLDVLHQLPCALAKYFREMQAYEIVPSRRNRPVRRTERVAATMKQAAATVT